MSFLKNIFKKITGEEKRIILNAKKSNYLINTLSELLKVFPENPPIGKLTKYDFGDTFKEEYDEFGLYCVLSSITHFILIKNKIFGTTENGEIVKFYELLYSYIKNNVMIDIIKKNNPNYSDNDYSLFVNECARIDIELIPLYMEAFASSSSKNKNDINVSVYSMIYTTIFKNKFDGMDSEQVMKWLEINIDKIDISRILLLWFSSVVNSRIAWFSASV